ncbi:MAG: XdhC family protein [Rhizobiaceae bacterium]
MEPINLKKLNTERRARRAVISVTELVSGRDRIIKESDAVGGELGEAVHKAFLFGKSGAIEADGASWFLNVHVPPPRIVVIGAVHISQALAPIAALADFDLEIIDPRTAFATPERFRSAKLYAEWPEVILKDRPLDAYTALAAVTHDPKIDDFPIQSALNANCFYVGALGSRKTHAKRLERLAAAGASEAQLQRIHAPIGLDIGASSPAEIAVATMAQIISAFRKRQLATGGAPE